MDLSGKEKTNKIPPNKCRDVEVRKKVRLMFGRRQDSMNSKCYVFSSYKQRNKVPLVFLEWQLQQDRYGSCIFKWKIQKTVERTYLETSKQQRRYP